MHGLFIGIEPKALESTFEINNKCIERKYYLISGKHFISKKDGMTQSGSLG